MYLHTAPTELKRLAPRAAVAIGNFDGVHAGHKAVIDAARTAAGVAGVETGVVTFDPHPRRVLRPDLPPFTLTPVRARARRIAGLGIGHMVALPFDKQFAATPARAFVDDILVGAMGVGHVAIGCDFAFGRGRAGNPETLTAWLAAHDVVVTVVPTVSGSDGAICSSTAIREALRRGDVDAATHALDAPWEIEGMVAHGDARGRQLGFPTANIALGSYLRPAAGAYAVQIGVPDAETTGTSSIIPTDPEIGFTWYPGVANIGTRPTVDGDDMRLEAHLFDTDLDLYDKVLRIRLIGFLRPETKFAGLDRLIAQIEADCLAARKLLGGAA